MNNLIKFGDIIDSPEMRNKINVRLNDPKQATQFIADLTSVVNNNPMLTICEAKSIISGGFVAQSLQLPLSNSLGLCYLVPYKTKNETYMAQFQLGAKGLLQLALRTCAYERIGYKEVREGEYKGLDEFGEPIIKFGEDESKKIIGYYAYFKFNKEHGGFVKKLYWTNEKLIAHAKAYSKAYGNGKSTDNWTYRFDDMAKKTVLKQIISKWGIISVEIQNALKYDQAVVEENGEASYIDNPNFVEKKPKQIANNKDIEVKVDLEKVEL